MKYDQIDKDLFITNRKHFTARMEPNSIAIFNSNDEMPSNGDGLFKFKQNSDLFYLSGIDQEDSILVLFPDAPQEKYREVLFLKETNEYIAVWHGHKYTKEEGQSVSGVTSIYWRNQMESILPMLMKKAETCYLNANENDRAPGLVPDQDARFAISWKERFPLHQYKRSAPIMHELRAIKSDLEISLMKSAVDITHKAFNRVLDFIEPGVYEYEVEAEILSTFLRHRGTGPAYSSIVASGANACILHYVDNNQACKDGDLILMDFGAEYANYCSDLTRTIPVNGKFSKRQREVYDAVLRVMKHCKTMFRPGTTLNSINEASGEVVEEELIKLGLIKKGDKYGDLPGYKKYFMHGLGHFIGLDTHDVGDRYAEIQPGMCFTNEPGIYIPEEGIGIRIENNLVVTDGDPIDLMEDFALEAEEIEEAMNSQTVKT